MKKSLLPVTMLMAFFLAAMNHGTAAACYGTSCRGLDPDSTNDGLGRPCPATAYTVYSWMDRTSSGSYGTVQTDLRYSTGCVSNWARG